MVNVLIAIVSDSFARIMRDHLSTDTILKIDLITEAIDLRILWNKLWKGPRDRKKKHYLYIIHDKNRPDIKRYFFLKKNR